MTIKNVALKGSQFLAYERMSREMKVNGGPGMIGKMHPIKPETAKINPRIIIPAVSVESMRHSS